MSVARRLFQLQEVDLELRSNEQSLRQKVSQLGESQGAIRLRTELSSQRQHLEEFKRQQLSAEREVDDLTNKIAALEQKLYSGRIGNPKELANLQHEVDGMKARRNLLEDRVLEIMEQVSEREARVATMGSEVGRLEVEWQGEQQQLLAEAERYKTTIADLKQRRQLLLASVESPAVSVYHQVKKQKGRAVAKVEMGTCRGCGITLSTAQLQQTKGDRLVRCSNCRRILFFA